MEDKEDLMSEEEGELRGPAEEYASQHSVVQQYSGHSTTILS